MNKRMRCIKLVKDLNDRLRILESMLSDISFEGMTYSPALNVWSPIQICKHLHLSESLSLKNATYNIGRAESRPAIKIKNVISSKGLSFALFSPLKFNSPPLTRFDETDQLLTQEVVFTDWWLTRKELKSLIKGCPNEAFSKQIYKHPFVGYLSLEQMLIFFQDHFKHHKKQIFQRLKSWNAR